MSGLFEVKPDEPFRSVATGQPCVSLLHLLHGEKDKTNDATKAAVAISPSGSIHSRDQVSALS
jgi:hypothetical protein